MVLTLILRENPKVWELLVVCSWQRKRGFQGRTWVGVCLLLLKFALEAFRNTGGNQLVVQVLFLLETVSSSTANPVYEKLILSLFVGCVCGITGGYCCKEQQPVQGEVLGSWRRAGNKHFPVCRRRPISVIMHQADPREAEDRVHHSHKRASFNLQACLNI